MFRTFHLGFLAAALFCAAAGAQAPDEYQVKAAFLYNFAKFVEWPPEAFEHPDDPIAICIVGPDPFGVLLPDTVKGKEAAGRFFVVRHVAVLKESGGCQIVFVAASERRHFSAILSRVKKCGVLTVGEADGFTAAGGVINFKLVDGRVRFEINLAEAQQRELRISSKLLSLAEVGRR